MVFSVLQAAKRNGGGVFVAFVVVGGGGRSRPSPSFPLWHAVSEEPQPFRLAERATHQPARARRQRSGQAVSREGRQAKRNPGLARARRLLRPALFVTACVFHGVPFGRKSHASTRKGTQATVWASSVSRGWAGQTESGTRKGTWVVEACAVRYCQRVSRGSVWPRTRWAFSSKLGARYGVAFSVLQAAKRNGGGVFVAFVVVGGGGRGRPSPSHPLWHAVSEEPPPFRLAERATHQPARARRQRSRQAVSREGGRAKRNPGLARARRLLKPALFVPASKFHGVPFGPVSAGLFRQSLGLVMVWLFRFCKRPNGMEVGFALLSLWWVAAEEAGLYRRSRCGTQ